MSEINRFAACVEAMKTARAKNSNHYEQARKAHGSYLREVGKICDQLLDDRKMRAVGAKEQLDAELDRAEEKLQKKLRKLLKDAN